MTKIFTFFLSFLFFINSKYIIIPLKKYTYNYTNDENTISKIYSNIYYTELSIGEPKQTIIAFINTTSNCNFGIYDKYCDKKFYLENSNINKQYSYQNSSTFYKIGNEDINLGKEDVLIKDQIKFYTNFELSEEIKFENTSILYNPNNEQYILDDVGIDFIIEKEKRSACGYIGLKLPLYIESDNNNLLMQLKENKIIDKTVFFFIEVNKNNDKYKNNNIEYLLIIGEEIYDIFNKKDINKYISKKYNINHFIEKSKLNDYIINEGFYFIWKINFNNIYLNINNSVIYLEQIKNVFLDNDYGLITGTKEYKNIITNNFFDKYINVKCFEKIFKSYDIGSFYYYICDEDIDIENFPTLYFKSKNYQYEFKLTKDDLFLKDNNKIYFLIVFEFSRTNTWKLGKPFLEKYLFSYNYDAKTVSFYNENLIEEKKEVNNNPIIIIIFVIFSLIALIIGFIFGKKIYKKRQKHDASELSDENLDYEYVNEEMQNKDKQKNFPIN